MKAPIFVPMKTLKDKIQLLDIKPRNAPLSITPDRFGKWLRAIKAGEEINPVAETVVTLVCDIELLLIKVRRGSMLSADLIYVKSMELSDAIDKMGEVGESPEETPGLVVPVDDGKCAAAPHSPVNCMAGTFTMKGGKRVFNLDGTFWIGGSDGVIAINGVEYEYPEKNFGNFKKKK